jgi:DNA-binding transcriptional ArsR family regulator
LTSNHSSKREVSSAGLIKFDNKRSGMDSFERLLWWLFAGSVGAKTRALVLYAIRDRPRNAWQLSQALGLDYTTVRHHLKVLESNRLIISEGNKYGKMYFVAEGMEQYWDLLERMLNMRRRVKR